MIEIKFCGLTRPEDAREAASLGARYLGIIFAESPRQLGDERAREVFAQAAAGAGRVGVFGATSTADIAARARQLALDVVQLHGDPGPATIADVRRQWSGQVWAVVRVEGTTIPEGAADLFDIADAVVLDARVAGRLGGTGVTLAWGPLRERVAPFRGRRAKLVLAGGLTPANVADAIDALQPDVVDVSSGVESSVGVKDPARMRAFRDAVRAGHPA